MEDKELIEELRSRIKELTRMNKALQEENKMLTEVIANTRSGIVYNIDNRQY